jgi:ketosteroid isomerase-like protein
LAVERVSPPEKREEGGDKHMSAEDNKAVVRREVEELYNHTGNLDVADEIIAPDYVSYEPTSGETRGIEGARQFAATFREAFPDLQCTINDMAAQQFSDGQVALDDLVVVPIADDVAYTLGTEHGQCKIGGKSIRVDWRVSNIYRREAGGWKIVHHHTDVSPAVVEALDHLRGQQG